jgi:glucosamine--fructose-6-phosphate aminotransferase (isomerizing)
MECALIPCKSYSTADFEHGPKALAQFGTAAIVYGPTPRSIDETPCALIRPETGPEGPLAPIWDIVFGQYLALQAARARGLDSDRPQNLSKVTQTL